MVTVALQNQHLQALASNSLQNLVLVRVYSSGTPYGNLKCIVL